MIDDDCINNKMKNLGHLGIFAAILSYLYTVVEAARTPGCAISQSFVHGDCITPPCCPFPVDNIPPEKLTNPVDIDALDVVCPYFKGQEICCNSFQVSSISNFVTHPFRRKVLGYRQPLWKRVSGLWCKS
jgi:hypothetical protein